MHTCSHGLITWDIAGHDDNIKTVLYARINLGTVSTQKLGNKISCRHPTDPASLFLRYFVKLDDS